MRHPEILWAGLTTILDDVDVCQRVPWVVDSKTDNEGIGTSVTLFNLEEMRNINGVVPKVSRARYFEALRSENEIRLQGPSTNPIFRQRPPMVVEALTIDDFGFAYQFGWQHKMNRRKTALRRT